MRIVLTAIICIIMTCFRPFVQEVEGQYAEDSPLSALASADCKDHEPIEAIQNLAGDGCFEPDWQLSCSSLLEWLVECECIRAVSTRLQFKSHLRLGYVKAFRTLLSAGTSSVDAPLLDYSTRKYFCWQRASDCYVFGLRRIII